jgi:hypothetical protein
MAKPSSIRCVVISSRAVGSSSITRSVPGQRLGSAPPPATAARPPWADAR